MYFSFSIVCFLLNLIRYFDSLLRLTNQYIHLFLFWNQNINVFCYYIF